MSERGKPYCAGADEVAVDDASRRRDDAADRLERPAAEHDVAADVVERRRELDEADARGSRVARLGALEEDRDAVVVRQLGEGLLAIADADVRCDCPGGRRGASARRRRA